MIGDKGNSVTISAKWGRLQFPKSTVHNLGLEGKYIRIYGDIAKKAVAWKVFQEGNISQLRGLRRISVKQNGSATIDIKGLLKHMKLKHDSYKGLEIHKYKESGLLESDHYNYVRLDDEML
jgi:hypothetical protein